MFTIFVSKKMPNNAVTPQSSIYTMSIIDICSITAPFGIFWRRTNIEVSQDLGTLLSTLFFFSVGLSGPTADHWSNKGSDKLFALEAHCHATQSLVCALCVYTTYISMISWALVWIYGLWSLQSVYITGVQLMHLI